MRRTLALIACAAAVVASPALAASRSFPVGNFDKLRVEGPFTVRVHTGSRPSINAMGPQARLDKLVVERRGGALVITSERGWSWGGFSWGQNETIVIDVSVPMLAATELTGSGDVTVDRIKTPAFATAVTGSGDLTVGRLDTGNLTASVTGSGDLTVTGQAARADARVLGSGDLHGAGLTVGQLTAKVTGSGNLAIGPARQANASVTGSGDISIAGRPACTISKRGSGDIRCGG